MADGDWSEAEVYLFMSGSGLPGSGPVLILALALDSVTSHHPLSAIPLLHVETARAGTSPAPDITATVAPFRAWRGSRLIVAEKPTRAAMEPCRRQSGRAARKVGAEHNKKEAVGGCFR